MAFLNPNLANLEQTAKALEPLLPELAFVGGTLTGLLMDDPGAGPIRVTKEALPGAVQIFLSRVNAIGIAQWRWR